MLIGHLLQLPINFSNLDHQHAEDSEAEGIADVDGDNHCEVFTSYGFHINYSTAQNAGDGKVDDSNNDLAPVTNRPEEHYRQQRNAIVRA